MPGLNQEIITGFRGPDQLLKTGPEVVKTHEQPFQPKPKILRLELKPGQVQFQSVNRRYRVQLTSPRNKLDPQTGMLISVQPLSLQFENNSVITDNVEIIHRVKGCRNVQNLRCETHKNKEQCEASPAKCTFTCPFDGHKDANGRPFSQHPSFGLCGDFWDAEDALVEAKKAQKAALIKQVQQVAEQAGPEEKQELLAALGVESFPLPPKEAPAK